MITKLPCIERRLDERLKPSRSIWPGVGLLAIDICVMYVAGMLIHAHLIHAHLIR
jgi:hypothetical protein